MLALASSSRFLFRPTPLRSGAVYALCVVILLLAGATVAHAAATPALSFGDSTPFGAGFGASATAVADLNRDGVPDLAVVNFIDETVSVLLGNVSAPGTYLAKVDYTAAEGAWDVAIADMNRDGVPDIVVLNCGCMGPLSIFFGLGDGTFAVREDYSVELFSPYAFAVGDLNRDGVLDVAISDDSMSTVAVLLGNVSVPGTFEAVQYNPVGLSPGGVRIGDFDRDGIPDLAVTDFFSNTISVLLGAGNGTFGSAIDYPTGPAPDALVIGDFNRDGLLDLAAGTDDGGSAHTISVLLGNVSMPGAFSAATEYPVNTPLPFIGLVAADVNGDGILDLAVTDQDSSVHVVTGNGDGSFNASESFEAGDTPIALAAADLDGDGRIDIVAGNPFAETVSVLLNTTVFTPSGVAFTQDAFSTGDGPRSLAVGDFNRDGIPDVVTTDKFAGASAVVVSLGVGDGTLGVPAALTGPMAFPSGVGVGDVNGDGAADVLWMNAGDGTLSVAFGNGDGTFQTPLATAARALGASYLAVADFNRDGLLDVAVSRRHAARVAVLLGAGDGTFERTDYAVGAGARMVAAGDIDGDGAPDLAVSNTGADSVSILLNTGDGTFAAKTDYTMGDQPRGVAIGDLNRDGIPDLVTANAGSFFFRPGNGDGTFGRRTSGPLSSPGHNVVIADMNRDGLADLIFGTVSGGQVTVLNSNGDGTFAAAQVYAARFSRVYVTVADMDRDGRLDIVTANRTDQTSSILLSRAATFAFAASRFVVAEGGAGSSALISVRRIGDLSTAMTVDFATAAGTATEGADYTETSGTLTFGVGENLKTFPVTILSDDAMEGPETVLLTLANPSGDAGLALPRAATLTIAANDRARLRFNHATYVTAEGAGSRTITVTRTDGFGTAVTVDYATSNGTAKAGRDYTAASGTLSFGPTDTSATFVVSIINDRRTEGEETINLTLSNPSAGAVLGSRSTAVVRITASD